MCLLVHINLSTQSLTVNLNTAVFDCDSRLYENFNYYPTIEF